MADGMISVTDCEMSIRMISSWKKVWFEDNQQIGIFKISSCTIA